MLFIQCESKPTRTTDQIDNKNSNVIQDLNSNTKASYNIVSKLIKHGDNFTDNKMTIDSIFTLDTELNYAPNVKTCLYIRSSPNINESNIIQCLIPEQSSKNISGMYHNLVATGQEVKDWAEFYYVFKIYTLKPDIEDQKYMKAWLLNRDKAHEAANKKYRTIRKKGWIKYRNDDGTINITIPKVDC